MNPNNNLFVQMVLHFLPELPDGVDLFDDDVQVTRPVILFYVISFTVTVCLYYIPPPYNIGL